AVKALNAEPKSNYSIVPSADTVSAPGWGVIGNWVEMDDESLRRWKKKLVGNVDGDFNG
ncbi:hypothetical protein Tco_0957896, partial [Tanacetum coccineum]